MVQQDEVTFNGSPTELEEVVPHLVSELWPDQQAVEFQVWQERRDRPLKIRFGKRGELPPGPRALVTIDQWEMPARPVRYGEITAHRLPGEKSLLIVKALDSLWPMLSTYWEPVTVALEKRGWIARRSTEGADWGRVMIERAVRYKGTLLQFRNLLGVIQKRLVRQDESTRVWFWSINDATINGGVWEVRFRTNDPRLRQDISGEITAIDQPGGTLLNIRATDDDWAGLEPGWNLLCDELRRLGLLVLDTPESIVEPVDSVQSLTGKPGHPGLDHEELIYRLAKAQEAEELRASKPELHWWQIASQIGWRYGKKESGIKKLEDARKRLKQADSALLQEIETWRKGSKEKK